MKKNEQLSIFNESAKADNEPVVCLGMTFESEEARREYFREELRKKLPELKQIEGFPIGEDEDIIALSDPPYYTACPNPWINDFIEEWEKEKVTKYGRNLDEEYHREPFSADVSEGKNNTVYNAHSYHTKVPYKAIMRYLLHYTKPGDIVFDGFCGSGMTGLASELCISKEEVLSLGYELDNNFIKDDEDNIISELGYRKGILNDLSPAATFISYNYNKKATKDISKEFLKDLIKQLQDEFAWIYKTFTSNEIEKDYFEEINAISSIEDLKYFINKYKHLLSTVEYLIWSESYYCNNCLEEMTYWEANVNADEQSVKKNLVCPKCGAEESKNKLKTVFESKIDLVTTEVINQPRNTLTKVNYSSDKNRFIKVPGKLDLKILEILQLEKSFLNITPYELYEGYNTNQPLRIGIDQVHHFYTERTLLLISKYLERIKNTKFYNDAQFLLGSVLPKMTKMNRYMPQYASKEKGFRALVGPMSNALYFPPLSVENNFFSQITFQLNKIINAWNEYHGNLISTQSSTSLNIKSNSIDYIFIDPPFGANIMYSEMSFARESWLKVLTNNTKEAIENSVQGKSINDYTNLILETFREAYRILKPNRWITVEFSNTKASVWNAIQFALQEAGFIIASVDALDKQRGGFHAMTSTIAVKQDLVISAYKPSEENINKMREQTNTQESAWTFINQHLDKLPVFLGSKGEASIIAERTPRILFDRMVAYHVQNGLPVPISSAEFQSGVTQRFPMRDGMAFLESQVAEYDKKRTFIKEFSQMSLFVSDENSAIEWIRQQLMKKPQTRQDLHPQFMKEIQHIAKHEQLPELDDLLAQNFLRYEGEETVPDQIASYLRRNYHEMRGLENRDDKLKTKAMNRWYVPDPNKQADLEKLREKTLIREFDSYVEELGTHKKKLKQFRTEAIRAGFKKAWSEKNYEKIVTVGDRLPEQVIQEDDKLLMYYDNAQVRLDM
ncbi:DNA methyltransferase [Bacillus toyonensis]|uniref:DNA methyltransferase n=1 Tax=Bacillus toyonensis TaxID=155322 RepID=UPI000BEB756B|nr:DNA methyltransferase [Bacillus toyonensis]MBJ8118465.1 DNA methylase [Bacillus cereus]PEB29153.1 DNA methylase [Bacillus toyonensis]HDR7918701.1 DNA methylase [Bacillus toyonensis]